MDGAEQQKRGAAEAAIAYVRGGVVGVGTGTTAAFFIDALAAAPEPPEAVVASSDETARLLRERDFRVVSLAEAAGLLRTDADCVPEQPGAGADRPLPVYVDGADEVDARLRLIKGRGGAHAREKVLAAAARLFVCIVDASKVVERLGAAPVPVEVLPMAETVAAARLVAMGGEPRRRPHFLTDNGNIVLDVAGLDLSEPERLEVALDAIPGAVANGVFAVRRADLCLVGAADGVTTLRRV